MNSSTTTNGSIGPSRTTGLNNNVLVLMLGLSLISLSCCVVYIYVVWSLQQSLQDMSDTINGILLPPDTTEEEK